MTGRFDQPRTPALVLLTATISPPEGVPGLVRGDPAQRLDDYLRALALYLQIPTTIVDRIVFADNSNSDLEPIAERVERLRGDTEVELLSFDGLDYPVEHGRVVGETRLIEIAFQRSRLLSGLGDDELFWKLTGRLRYPNLVRLITTAPEGCALYADFRRIPRQWIDLRVFACTPQAFRSLFAPRAMRQRQDEVERMGFRSPEQRLAPELLAERDNFAIVPRLRVEPRLEGFNALGENYGRPARRLWAGARGVARRVLPWLWV
jgi:hypothetical protein